MKRNRSKKFLFRDVVISSIMCIIMIVIPFLVVGCTAPSAIIDTLPTEVEDVLPSNIISNANADKLEDESSEADSNESVIIEAEEGALDESENKSEETPEVESESVPESGSNVVDDNEIVDLTEQGKEDVNAEIKEEILEEKNDEEKEEEEESSKSDKYDEVDENSIELTEGTTVLIPGKNYYLTKDITIYSAIDARNWAGLIEGNSHTITVRYGYFAVNYLAGEINNLKIKNVTLINQIALGTTLKFTNCQVLGEITKSTGDLGGFVNTCYGSVSFNSCENNANISGGTKVGGFVGKFVTQVEYINSYLGFQGVNAIVFVNCDNNGNIQGQTYASGFVGLMTDGGWDMTDCVNNGNITSGKNVAAILCWQDDLFYYGKNENVTNNGTLKGTDGEVLFHMSKSYWAGPY